LAGSTNPRFVEVRRWGGESAPAFVGDPAPAFVFFQHTTASA